MSEEEKKEKIALPFNFRVNQCRNYLRLAVNTAASQYGLDGAVISLIMESLLGEEHRQQVISNKDDSYVIAQGYHDGSGTVGISETEKEKLIPTNIREGINILGVDGQMSGSEGMKPQSKTITPSSAQQTILPDEGYNCLSQVVVEKIPYVESENSAGGLTVTIG